MDYKATLNLPETDFPMKADLANREKSQLEKWQQSGLYARILDARRGQQPWVLHDGPPYANGNIHYGHILNKVLKDLVCKSRTMAGYYVEYKPGWDCHGLPIELAVQRALGDKIAAMSAVEVRAACHEYAMKWVDTQRTEFQRLGIFGTWDQPYLTLSKEYEATIVRQLAEFAQKGLLYHAKKPVHWCMSDKTALAEAEIEYDEAHVSPSIYVKFATPEAGLFAVIWTTTPWTLPANWAIVYHPNFEYVEVHANGERYIVAKDLADKFVAACALTEDGPRTPFPVGRFEQLDYALHPFMEGRHSRLLPATYVTLEQGTGLVHTAPGHGADDYATGIKFGLQVDAPVNDGGVFSDGPWKGEFIFKANPKIVEHLAKTGALLSPPALKVTHAYPICWRCKNPVIFRATEQLFARMDGDATPTLREVAMQSIAQTQWIPAWGQNRIGGMIENRPDWVLSRQRVWGVPIPIVYRDGQPTIDATVMNRIADLFEKEGADAWFGKSVEEMLGPDFKGYEKGKDIVDVWFESGVSWAAVCEGRKGLDSSTADDPRPVDLYLEGSDQHRGWFHSALLTSAATRGHAPYRAVMTHGFVLDDKGRPYSKSDIERRRKAGEKVDYLPPQTLIDQQGAELFRLWVSQADFRSDVQYSKAHLTQLGESYRKLRNTMRFLLGNLSDFDPARDSVAPEALADRLDRYVYDRAVELEARVRKAYDDYEFHVVLRALVDFSSSELSSLYCDVRKDRLYCDAKLSPERRATQTVLYRCLRAVTIALAPICCFTAEEIWSHMRKLPGDPDSVHLALMPKGAQPAPAAVERAAEMARLLDLRARVQKELEPFRAQKKASLDAHVTLTVPAADAQLIGTLPQGWLADLFIVSQVTVKLGEPAVSVADAAGNRCERCWKWSPDTPAGGLDARCQHAVGQAGH